MAINVSGGGAAHGASDHADRTRYLFLDVAASTGSRTENYIGTLPGRTSAFNLPNGASNDAIWNLVTPADLVAGVPTCVVVWRDDTSEALTFVTNLNSIALSAGADPTGAGTTTSLNIATGSSLNVQRTTITFPISLSPNTVYRVAFSRLGGDGSDSAAGVMQLLGIELQYTADM